MEKLVLVLFFFLLFSSIASAESTPLSALEAYLSQEKETRPPLLEMDFVHLPLNKKQAMMVQELLFLDYVTEYKAVLEAEKQTGWVTYEEVRMQYWYKHFGASADGKNSLYISLHGGGGTTQAVNDSQWENQKNLYTLREGIYLVPRAPTNTWDLWHLPHIDPLLSRLIETFIVTEQVDPNRVYLLGYSAGGDGVYQLAPRMACQFAAAAMMAGHPNDALPYSLRNLGFTIQMGGRDSAYDRNKVALEWRARLENLREEDPEGYPHWVVVYPQHGHWMGGDDRVAIPWMANFTRNPFPEKVVWHQARVVKERFYWLALPKEEAKQDQRVVASFSGQTIHITQSDPSLLRIRLHDAMLDLDEEIEVFFEGDLLYRGGVSRTIATIYKTLMERRDPAGVFFAELTLQIR